MPGITTKELMARIGHSSSRAALIYQHASEERTTPLRQSLMTLSTARPAISAANSDRSAAATPQASSGRFHSSAQGTRPIPRRVPKRDQLRLEP